MAKKAKEGKRGLAFTAPELESLAETVEEVVPISHTDWDKVRDQHNEYFPSRIGQLILLGASFSGWQN